MKVEPQKVEPPAPAPAPHVIVEVKPKPTPAPASPPEPKPEAPAPARGAPHDAEAAALIDSLEAEMARLLGRAPKKG